MFPERCKGATFGRSLKESRMRILVVEDNETYVQQAYAQLAGHEITRAYSLMEAFRAIRETEYDVALSDLYIPYRVGDGRGPLPLGLYVAIFARKHGARVAICTAGFHHAKANEVSALVSGMFEVPFIDVEPGEMAKAERVQVTEDNRRNVLKRYKDA
jgi:CheY-like chemotaxis protein